MPHLRAAFGQQRTPPNAALIELVARAPRGAAARRPDAPTASARRCTPTSPRRCSGRASTSPTPTRYGWAELERLVAEARTLAEELGGTGADPVRSAGDAARRRPALPARRCRRDPGVARAPCRRDHRRAGPRVRPAPGIRDVECVVAEASSGVVYYTPAPPDGSVPSRIVWTIPSGVPVAAIVAGGHERPPRGAARPPPAVRRDGVLPRPAPVAAAPLPHPRIRRGLGALRRAARRRARADPRSGGTARAAARSDLALRAHRRRHRPAHRLGRFRPTRSSTRRNGRPDSPSGCWSTSRSSNPTSRDSRSTATSAGPGRRSRSRWVRASGARRALPAPSCGGRRVLAARIPHRGARTRADGARAAARSTPGARRLSRRADAVSDPIARGGQPARARSSRTTTPPFITKSMPRSAEHVDGRVVGHRDEVGEMPGRRSFRSARLRRATGPERAVAARMTSDAVPARRPPCARARARRRWCPRSPRTAACRCRAARRRPASSASR